jgi:hypothetical protein
MYTVASKTSVPFFVYIGTNLKQRSLTLLSVHSSGGLCCAASINFSDSQGRHRATPGVITDITAKHVDHSK